METNKIIDTLGRIVIPSSFRQKLGISTNDRLKLKCDGEKIIITSLRNTCKICGSEDNMSEKFPLCKPCIKRIIAEAIIWDKEIIPSGV